MRTLKEILRDKADIDGLDNLHLAEKLSISEFRLGRILSGTETCTSDDLRKISDAFSYPIIDLYIAAGLIKNEDLEQYQRVFNGVDNLSEIEREHIQETIYMLGKSREIEKEYI